MSIRYKLEKFGVELEPNAYITDVQISRKWNIRAKAWVHKCFVKYDIYSESDKVELVESKSLILQGERKYSEALEKILAEVYTLTTGMFNEGKSDEKKKPTKRAKAKPATDEEVSE